MVGCGGGGRGDTPFILSRCTAATSIDCDRGPSSSLMLGSDRGGSALLVLAQLRASIERLSSIGVNILWLLAAAGIGLGCGKGGLVKSRWGG